MLVRITPSTEFQSLYTELASALQLHEEIQQKASTSGATSTAKSAKPFIYFTQPRYVKSMAKAMFPGDKSTNMCWNCGMKGHRFTKCHKTLNMAKIAANKAEYFFKKGQTKGNREKSGKRVLYELVTGLNELCSLESENEDISDAMTTYFGDIIDSEDHSADESIDDDSTNICAALNFNAVTDEEKSSKNLSDEDF